ncbi:MAG: dihydropyrimidinase [Neisseriales bacterium]|nr:MAG: dihydropyrimidinase [Neisseriales bacterium]
MDQLLIKNGIVVNVNSEVPCDLLIEEGIIRELMPHQSLLSKNIETIDAKGCYVMPGGVDVHTHFDIDVGLAKSCDDFYTGTVSAACGGTTTIVDHMGFGPSGCSLHHQLDQYQVSAQNSVIDYSFHGVIQHVDASILREIPQMVHQAGISSFKIYLTYQFKLSDAAILDVLEAMQAAGAVTTVHPENDAAIARNRSHLVNTRCTAPIYHAISRPLECEAEAIARVINLAKLANNAPLYIVHLSNGLGLDYIKLAKAANQPIWCETCPQYVLLDMRYYEKQNGQYYIASPPLRPKAECDKLWVGIASRHIDTIATDHCAFTVQQKQIGQDDFTKCPNGLPGVETRLPLLFSEGVVSGRISVRHFVELVSTMPAKLFGLFPQKGCIAQGSDADIVIMDPKRRTVLRHQALHSNAGYTPFEGFVINGWPIFTLSRGQVVAKNGQFIGRRGWGKFLPRQPFSL